MLHRTFFIRPIADDDAPALGCIGPFRSREIEILMQLLPSAAIWTTADDLVSCFEPSIPALHELYELMRSSVDEQLPSTEPYVIGYTFGTIPVLCSPLELFNRLLPYLEAVLKIEKPLGTIQIRQSVEPPLA